MSSHYSSTPYSNPPAYVPKSPTYDPNHDSREGISAASGPYMPTTQYNTNAYGRQQQPGPALHRGGSELRPSQPGHPQYQPDQTAQPYRPNEQYRHDVNPGPSTPRHASIDMARVSSAGSYGTENESPQSYNPAEGPKECVDVSLRLFQRSESILPTDTFPGGLGSACTPAALTMGI